jgi:hypothetical protein
MQNAHLRLARLEYVRSTVKTQTHISVYVSHLIGEGEQAHLISFFGNDAEVGAVTAAIQESHRFDLVTCEGKRQHFGFGQDASVYKANLNLNQQKRAIRHVVAISSWLHANGSAGKTFLWNGNPDADPHSWAALANLQGVPAVPCWGSPILTKMREDEKIQSLFGVGCAPAVVNATRDDLLERIGQARKANLIAFPEKNGPIVWPSFQIQDALTSQPQA